MKKFSVKANLLIAVALVSVLVLSGCMPNTEGVNPGAWGYDCKVIYNALGGTVGSREIRTTYYMSNSYVYSPAGTSGMLVAPVRDGYLLAGWYTSYDTAEADSKEDYSFNPQDRWDFYVDRIQEGGTIYARWIPRGKVTYLDPDTGNKYEKNITQDSPITAPSDAMLNLSFGTTNVTYFSDEACTIPYDFSAFVFVESNPGEKELYTKLSEQFPQYFEEYAYVEPEEEASEGEEDMAETILDTSWHFLNQAGYQLTEAGLDAMDEIQAAKNELVEEYIQGYLENNANQVVYVKVSK